VKAFTAAARSVAILAATEHESALNESLETRARLRAKLTGGTR
jgi:hypothetical protein